MDTVEDNLGQIQAILYLLAVLISFAHLPLALSDIKRNFWKQAIIRLITFISPLIIMLGTDGLISHFIGWQPISDTDRFHMLHHTVFAGLPLTLSYWLGLHVWWQPATFNVDSSLSRRSWLTSGVILIWFVMLIGILSGIISPIIFGSTVVIGLLAVPIIWKFAV